MQGKKEILVSVVIPIYNVERYIRKCIESVMNQTWRNLEIICVNDGTMDASMDIVEELKGTDERFMIINIENSGLSAARNTGMKAASGKYICFVDSDDYLAGDAIEQLVRYGEKHRTDVVFYNAQPVFETEEIEKRQSGYKNYYSRKGRYPKVYRGEELFIRMMKHNAFKPSACLLFLNRNFLECVGLHFYPGILHEDNLFTLQLIQKARRALLLKKELYKRLIREASITSGKKGIRNAYGFFVCQREMELFVKENEVSPEFRAALRKYLDICRKNARNILKGMSVQDIRKGICQLDAGGEEAFIKYIEAENVAITPVMDKQSLEIAHKIKVAQKMKSCGKRWLGKGRKSIRAVLKKALGNPKAEKVLKFFRWLFWTVRNYGVEYFFYRKNLKRNPQKVCVSIIIPVYNTERYLRQTLDCLIGQVLKNIEIICVDDGSTDSSREILQEYQKKDSRIKVFLREKSGAGAARNYGMKQAVGEYLLFLDADDIFDENLCNEVYYQCSRREADICLFGAKRLNMQSLVTEPMNWVLKTEFMPEKKVFSGQDAAKRIFQITTGCAWSKMFRRKFVLESGLQFQNLPNINDAYFVRMCMATADRITFVPRRFVTYRFNEGSNIQSNKAQAPTAFHEAFKAIKAEMCSRQIYNCFEQSFCNMVLKESLFNLRTAGTKEAEKSVRDLLRTEILDYYGLEKHSADYYYDKKEYQEMKNLLEGRDT